MDEAWLSDGDMERQEEEYRLECHAAQHDYFVNSFLLEDDRPDFYDAPHLEGEMAKPASSVLQASLPTSHNLPSSKRGTPDPPIDAAPTTPISRIDVDVEEMGVLLPEATSLCTPTKETLAKITRKRDLTRMRSATMDPQVMAKAQGIKRRRLLQKTYAPMYVGAASVPIAPEVNVAPEAPSTKADLNKMWNHIYTQVRSAFKNSDEYKALDWASGASHYAVLRKGLRDYWSAQTTDVRAAWLGQWMSACEESKLRSHIAHLRLKLLGGVNCGKDELKRHRLSMGLLTWVNRKWQVKLSPAQKAEFDADQISACLEVVEEGQNMGRSFSRYAEATLRPALGYKHYAMCVELCCQTYVREKVAQLHFHMFWFDAPDTQLPRDKLKKLFTFQGQEADFSPCRMVAVANRAKAPRGRALDKIIKKSLFYILGPKRGQVWTASDQNLDWSGVNPAWVTELVASEKMLPAKAKEAYAKCLHNARHNVEQLDYVLRLRQELRLEKEEE